MNNTVLVESKLRKNLRLVCALMCVFCVCFVAVLICVALIGKQNLNGQTIEKTQIIDNVFETESNVITMKDGTEYNVVWSDDVDVDWNDYKGKTVTLIVTQNTFGGSNPWILGLVADGQTIVDYNETLQSKTAENNELKTIFIAVAATLCGLTCLLFIWRFNITPHVERPLYAEFADFLSERQPACKERKFLGLYLCVYFAILGALLLTAILLDPDSESFAEIAYSAKIVLWILLAVAVAGMAGLCLFAGWIRRREIDFYAQNLPFDFYDISHVAMRKKFKEQLQAEMKKELEENPDTYADGGNGYDVTFDEKGVTLSLPFEEEQINMPQAEEVFDYNEQSNASNGATRQDDVVRSNNERQHVITLPYERLNFEAVAHYRRQSRPMMIIVKSRLEKADDLPEQLINDIHIPFDLNLQNTLTKFDVSVENLDYLLNNKKQLMLENCLKRRKSTDKMPK